MRKFKRKEAEKADSLAFKAKVSSSKCTCTKPRNFRDSQFETCGKFCKHLSASEQKDIIFKRPVTVCGNTAFEKHNYVLPAQWWRVWCDFVNIEYKSLREHFKHNKAMNPDASKCAEKEPMSTLKITEESDIDFDLKSYKAEEFSSEFNSKRESKITNLLRKDSVLTNRLPNDSVRYSVIPNDDRYNEIYTRYVNSH